MRLQSAVPEGSGKREGPLQSEDDFFLFFLKGTKKRGEADQCAGPARKE